MDAAVAEVARRLRSICYGWTEEDFNALVRVIAQAKVRWVDAGRDV